MKQILYLFLSLFLFSCGNNKKETIKKKQEKPKRSVVSKHIGLKNVSPEFKNEIENWQDLQTVTLFIEKFENVSPNEALINALELRDLVASLKDSEIPKFCDIPSFHARINVLYNETLRLADLTLIPAISSQEVNLQVNKTIAAFSSLNSKINTIYSKKRFEDAIDIKIDYIGIDSTLMDTVSKESIKFKKRKKFIDTKNYIKKK
ncbi:hypothetical protein [uncultured Polaribacter sp.]|uniref:hypothetical protein n=1 Tax=uncultured Polaribacter sp. TaxID=174711 RepID=UPI002633528B|nr:hypothetical protein [uncultured Polaribacter sp.]